MKNSFKKYQNYIVFGGMALIFLLLVLIATRGDAPYNSLVLSIGTLRVAWYAIFILTGIIFGTILAYLELVRKKIDPNVLWDGLLIFVPLAIVGARFWYVIFNLDRYANNPIEMIYITEGGLGIHGAIIAVFIGLIIFTKIKKVNYFYMLDLIGPGFLIGQTMGRWGNFMNRELYGPAVDNLDWLPSFIKDNLFINNAYRQPTFLYESAWNLVGLILILVFRNKKFVKLGDVVSFYLVWYGIGRIPNELLRMQSGVDEPLMLLGIPVSIATSVGLILAGVLIFVLKRVLKKDMNTYEDYGKKAVLFDLDGTLLDTIDLIYKNTKDTFKEFFPDLVLDEKTLKTFVGPTLEESFSWYEKDEVRRQQMIDKYREHNHKNHAIGVPTFAHAKEVLESLKTHDYLIGIVSSKKNEFVKLGLEQNGLLGYVDVIIGSDDTTKHKPDKEPFILALNALSVSPTNAIYVGDHQYDILGARNAGIRSVGVSYSIHYHELLTAKPDYMIDDLEKLLFIL